jgi:hypothetical protein
MKTRILSTLVVCLAAGFATASAATLDLITVKLPYATNIGKTVLPAGDYSVRGLDTLGSTSVLEFTSATGRSISVLVSEIAAPNGLDAPKSEVILRSEDGKYQIDKVWIEGRDHGFQLQTSNPR